MNSIKRTTREITEISPTISTASSAYGSIGSAMSAGASTNIGASGSDVIASAFSAKASGLESSGIVPSVMDTLASCATPATLTSVNQHPSLMSSFFASIGSYLHNISKENVNIKIKDPS